MSVLWDAPGAVAEPEFRPGELSTKFLQPPFTVLDTRKGDWQERRRTWLSLGIRSELGRGSDLLSLSPAEGARARWAEAGDAKSYNTGAVVGQGGMVGQMAKNFAGTREAEPEGEPAGGTSIFDPVLCELAYRWFAPPGGLVLDPFAGGSVRGIVAAKLGHPYTGVDLSSAQLAANREQAAAILAPSEPVPSWLVGDARHLDELLPAGALFDMVLTCPPYYDLEVYSDDPADLSAAPDYGAFLEGYGHVLDRAAARLRPERFAVIVVSEIRDGQGYCRGLVPDTVRLGVAAGLRLYNEAVLVNSVGSLPLRVTKYMESSRKLGRAHQNVLIFLRGTPPRGWSYDRAAPPSPQLDLHLLPDEPPPAALEQPASPAPLAAPAVAAPEPVLSGADEAPADPGPSDAVAAITRCEDHPDGHHATQAEADQCDAELMGEPIDPARAGFDQLEDGRWVDTATGALYAASPEGGPGEPWVEPAPVARITHRPEALSDGVLRCTDHMPGFHSTALEASACTAGAWWQGWPSVIPVGPPGSGATPRPPEQQQTMFQVGQEGNDGHERAETEPG